MKHLQGFAAQSHSYLALTMQEYNAALYGPRRETDAGIAAYIQENWCAFTAQEISQLLAATQARYPTLELRVEFNYPDYAGLADPVPYVLVRHIKDPVVIVHKLVDEWYYLMLAGRGGQPMQLYKCDQLAGLLAALTPR